MASSSAGNSTNGPKQGIPITAQNSLLGTPQTPLEDEANSEAEVEPGSSSDSMNVSSSTRVPAKIATSAFEIIAVEMQPDSASSPGNGNLHHSSLSLGGVTNDTDQEQDFQMNGNGVPGEEGLSVESDVDNLPVKNGPTLLHLSPPQDVVVNASVNNNTVNSEALITATNLPANVQSYSMEPPQQNVSVAPPSVLPSVPTPVPAPSISTIKTETGREITILKVEAEFRRGRWACSDYHDHRDTSPPPPNPSPAAGVLAQPQLNSNPTQTQAQQVMQSAPPHLPVLLEQQPSQQQQPNSVQQIQKQPGANSMAPPPAMGMAPMPLQQPPRYNPQQQQQTCSSTQQMVEKTAAALSRALSTDPAVYQTSAAGSFTGFSGHTGMAAPVMMQSANTAAAMVGGPPGTGFFSTGHVAPGGTGCVADLAAIEHKVAQALDLVKKYLMAAVRHELEAMQGEVVDLQNRLEACQRENELLRAKVPDDVLQNLLLAEQISAPVPQMIPPQPQAPQQLSAVSGTPLGAVPAMVDNQTVSMATPPSPSFALSSTSPNSNQLPKATSTATTVRQQPPQPQTQTYYNQRDRSPSVNSVDLSDHRSNNNGEGSTGFEDSSSAAVVQT